MASGRSKELDAHLKRQAAAIEDYVSKVRLILSRELSSRAARGGGGTGSIKNLIAILNAIDIDIADGELPRAVRGLANIYADDVQFLLQDFKQLGVKLAFSNVDELAIRALIDFDVQRVMAKSQEYISDTKAEIARTVLLGQRPDFKAIDERVGGSLESNLKTELTTAVSAFNRTITLKKAKDVKFERFIYLGPLDDVTRPFCAERVGNVYTLDEIQDWDNGTDLPADIYCGGYNCRHQLRPVE